MSATTGTLPPSRLKAGDVPQTSSKAAASALVAGIVISEMLGEPQLNSFNSHLTVLGH